MHHPAINEKVYIINTVEDITILAAVNTGDKSSRI